MKDIAHDRVMAEVLRGDPLYAKALLDEVLRDGDYEELAILLRQIQPSDSWGLIGDTKPSL
ncbi:hypothetical protein ACG3RT_11685 [Pseudomonas aeruginosa]|uniref:hypothetical protein n=1 Tax=Pseudomonas aeruginosa TaxID=287 RepID=UPI00208EE87E